MRETGAGRAAEELPTTGKEPPTAPGELAERLEGYRAWLARQPLSERTRRVYAGEAGRFGAWLASVPCDAGDPLADPHARDYAVRDYKAHLKAVRKAAPRTVNLALAAADSFYRYLGLGPAAVRREDLPAEAPRALGPDEQRRFLRAVERSPRARDRALATLLFYAALRLGEAAALDDADVALSARRGRVVVRRGKGDAHREVALNAEARAALDAWRTERRRWPRAAEEPALFLSRRGARLTTRAVDLVLRELGAEAGVAVSAHVLRHTCLTNLVRQGNDVVLVAEVAGHRRLETTRRYSLPSAADREAAMERLAAEH